MIAQRMEELSALLWTPVWRIKKDLAGLRVRAPSGSEWPHI